MAAPYVAGQGSPPENWVRDNNDPTWWHNPDPNIDINNMENWWQEPPAGFLPDPNSPGWWYDPAKNVAIDNTAWWHDVTVIDDPASKALGFWKLEEIAAAAGKPTNPNVMDNWPHICRAAALWGMDEPLILIGFLGTMMKETGTLYPVREAWWVWNVDPQAAIRYYLNTALHAAYQGGWEYHGRGYVQLTHVGNYQMVQNALAEKGIVVDLVGNPDLMLQPEWAAHGLCLYFRDHAGGIMPNLCRQRNWTEVRHYVWGQYGDAEGVGFLQQADAVLSPLAVARKVLDA